MSPNSTHHHGTSEDPAPPRRWLPEEDERLRKAVQKMGEQNWNTIAQMVESRNGTQCLQRWKKVLHPDLIKGQWNADEDARLTELHEQGFKNWGQLAQNMKGRTSKQCRERWVHHLSPEINRAEWTPVEDRIILESHQKMGNHWAQIAKLLNGRTENAIKVRCKALQRQGQARARDDGGGSGGDTTTETASRNGSHSSGSENGSGQKSGRQSGNSDILEGPQGPAGGGRGLRRSGQPLGGTLKRQRPAEISMTPAYVGPMGTAAFKQEDLSGVIQNTPAFPSTISPRGSEAPLFGLGLSAAALPFTGDGSACLCSSMNLCVPTQAMWQGPGPLGGGAFSPQIAGVPASCPNCGDHQPAGCAAQWQGGVQLAGSGDGLTYPAMWPPGGGAGGPPVMSLSTPGVGGDGRPFRSAGPRMLPPDYTGYDNRQPFPQPFHRTWGAMQGAAPLSTVGLGGLPTSAAFSGGGACNVRDQPVAAMCAVAEPERKPSFQAGVFDPMVLGLTPSPAPGMKKTASSQDIYKACDPFFPGPLEDLCPTGQDDDESFNMSMDLLFKNLFGRASPAPGNSQPAFAQTSPHVPAAADAELYHDLLDSCVDPYF